MCAALRAGWRDEGVADVVSRGLLGHGGVFGRAAGDELVGGAGNFGVAEAGNGRFSYGREALLRGCTAGELKSFAWVILFGCGVIGIGFKRGL